MSVEEECDGGADGAPVFPQAQVSTVQSSLDGTHHEYYRRVLTYCVSAFLWPSD